MKIHEISGKTGHSRILVGKVMEDMGQFLPEECPLVIITDETVRHYYEDRFPTAKAVISIGTGEKIKTLDTVRMIYERLVSIEADRSVFVLGIGGGIVCDVTGFAASTYLRGVRFGYIPTTLLAQVDAGVGGKTGVNFRGYKNMVGTFTQPEMVACDPRFIGTLPEEERACGFAEIVKHAAIADPEYFETLERFAAEGSMQDVDMMASIVYQSVVIKADIVNRDEREKGERRKLNFGHTLGHALEKTAGLRHGQAVSVGMTAAARLSVEKNRLSGDDARRLVNLLEALHLPTRAEMDVPAVIDALARDKKREGDQIHFVLLNRIGDACIEAIRLNLLEKVLVEGQKPATPSAD
ncbi:MAG: 3-dehydroquinate synthase [Thermodesulfobacteriota bacterium]